MISHRRKIWNLVGAVFVLLPIATLILLFGVGAIHDYIQEKKYHQFNRALQVLLQEHDNVVSASEVSLPSFVPSEWQEVCIAEIYCGTSQCDPYVWQITFKGNGYSSIWPIDGRIFGQYYSADDLKIPHCLNSAEAQFILDKKGLRVVKIR